MKGISPMVATVLLLAFTVAVGGIISVWMTGLTRTQTAGVTIAAQCASTRLDLTASITAVGNATPGFPGTVQVTYTNLGPEIIYPQNITLSCGSAVNTTWATEAGGALAVGFSNQKLMVVGAPCGTNSGNLTVSMAAKCGSDQKATVYAECLGTNC